MVHPADIQDRDGGVLLLSRLFGMYQFLKKLFADAGYQGPQFAMAVAQILPELAVEIVKRSDQASGFVVLPMRWVVERTLAWLNRCRRLAKDFGRSSVITRWRSSAWHQSASCCESFAIPHRLSGRSRKAHQRQDDGQDHITPVSPYPEHGIASEQQHTSYSIAMPLPFALDVVSYDLPLSSPT